MLKSASLKPARCSSEGSKFRLGNTKTSAAAISALHVYKPYLGVSGMKKKAQMDEWNENKDESRIFLLYRGERMCKQQKMELLQEGAISIGLEEWLATIQGVSSNNCKIIFPYFNRPNYGAKLFNIYSKHKKLSK